MSESLTTRIRRRVAEDLAADEAAALDGDDRREFARQRAFLHLDAFGADDGAATGAPRSPVEEQQLAQSVLDALFGLGRLQSLVDDDRIENIDVNGCDRVWATFADGSKRLMDPVADSDDELVDLLRSAAGRFGLTERRFDTARPELDLQLPGGARLSAVMAVAARPAVSIRRHRFTDLSLDELCTMGAMDDGLCSLLSAAVRARKNIVVSGAMNSGKTTLLRALAAEIDRRERIVTIEQAFELGLDTGSGRHPDMVALEARPANIEGEGRIPVADLVRRSLRMNADRVIVGEVLGDEVLPMLNAMSQGRSGSMCTIHAESSAGVFRRIASYAVQAPERLPLEATNLLIAGALHFVVHLDSDMHDGGDAGGPDGGHQRRTPHDEDRWDDDAGDRTEFPALGRRARFVASVREVVDAEGVQVVSNEIYRPGPDRRAVPSAPLRPGTVDELVAFGYETGGAGTPGVPPVIPGGRDWTVAAVGLLCGLGVVGLWTTLNGRARAGDDAGASVRGEPTVTLPDRHSTFAGRLPGLILPAAVGVVSVAVTGWPAAGAVGALAAYGVPRLLRQTSGSVSIARIEAVATWTEMLQGTLAASAGLGQAIIATADLSPGPIRPATEQLAAQLRAGAHPRDALLQFAEVVGDPCADRVVCSLLLASTARAQRLGDLLQALAESTREEVSLRLRVETSRASVRSGVRTVVVFSVVFAAGLAVFARSYLAPFGSSTGQLVLLAVGALYAAGLTLMVALARPPAPVRLLGRSVMLR